MIDALLLAVERAILAAPFGYDGRTCGLTFPDGSPPPVAGAVYVGIHEGASRSRMDNALDEYFAWSVTLTMRAVVPNDRIPDALITREIARKIGFNVRAEQLRAFLHMNWAVLGDANNILMDLNPQAQTVHGFCEPARYRGMERPGLVGPEWFKGEDGEDAGVKAELRFEDCRRLQPIGSYL